MNLTINQTRPITYPTQPKNVEAQSSETSIKFSGQREDEKLFSAIKKRNPDDVKNALTDGANPDAFNGTWTPLTLAAEKGEVNIIKHLLEKGANLLIPNVTGTTPFTVAAAKNNVPAMGVMLEGARERNLHVDLVNAQDQSKTGWTPLTLASNRGHTETVRFLLEQGAKVTTKAKDGRSPFTLASASGKTESMTELLEAATKENINLLNALDGTGHLPVTAAAKGQQIDSIVLLHQKGANFKLKNGKKMTALDYAKAEKTRNLAIQNWITSHVLGQQNTQIDPKLVDKINKDAQKRAEEICKIQLKAISQMQEELQKALNAVQDAQKEHQTAQGEAQKKLDQQFRDIRSQLASGKIANESAAASVEAGLRKLNDFNDLYKARFDTHSEELNRNHQVQIAETRQIMANLRNELSELKDTNQIHAVNEKLQNLEQGLTRLQDSQVKRHTAQEEAQQQLCQQFEKLQEDFRASKSLTMSQKQHFEGIFKEFTQQQNARFDQLNVRFANIHQELAGLKTIQEAQKVQYSAQEASQKQLHLKFEQFKDQLASGRLAGKQEMKELEVAVQHQINTLKEMSRNNTESLKKSQHAPARAIQERITELEKELQGLQDAHLDQEIPKNLRLLQEELAGVQRTQEAQHIAQQASQNQMHEQLEQIQKEVKHSKALTEAQKQHFEGLFRGFAQQQDARFDAVHARFAFIHQELDILKSTRNADKLIPELKTHYEITLQKHFQDAIKELRCNHNDDLQKEKEALDKELRDLRRPKGPDNKEHTDDKQILNTLVPNKANEADVDNLLKRNPAYLNAGNQQGFTPLINAATNGQIEVVRKLLRLSGLDINHQDRYGRSALHWLVSNTAHNMHERQEILEALLEKPGLNVNSTTLDGDTPLMQAVRNNAPGLVKMLVSDPRVDISHHNRHGETAVSLASENPQMMEILEAANLKRMDERKSRRYYDASQIDGSRFDNGVTPLLKAIELKDYEKFNELIAQGVDVNEFNRVQFKETPLMLAAAKGDSDMIVRLLAANANPYSVDASGANAIHYAAQAGNTKTMEPLLALNGPRMDINQQDSTGCTPLMKAAMGGHTEAVSKLLEKGANLTQVNQNHNTALIEAALCGQTTTVTQLLSKGADMHHLNGAGSTAFLEAAVNGHPEVMKALLGQVYDLNKKKEIINQGDYLGNTALIKAAQQKRAEVITFLTDFEGTLDVNKANKQGHTALMELAVTAKNLTSHGITGNEKEEAEKAHKALDALLRSPGLNIKQKRSGPLSSNALERAVKKSKGRDNSEAKAKMEAYIEEQKKFMPPSFKDHLNQFWTDSVKPSFKND